MFWGCPLPLKCPGLTINVTTGGGLILRLPCRRSSSHPRPPPPSPSRKCPGSPWSGAPTPGFGHSTQLSGTEQVSPLLGDSVKEKTPWSPGEALWHRLCITTELSTGGKAKELAGAVFTRRPQAAGDRYPGGRRESKRRSEFGAFC